MVAPGELKRKRNISETKDYYEMNYLLHLWILLSIYSIVCHSLNLLVGYSGLVSLGHAAFFGIGAYTAAILTTKLGFSFLFGVVFAVIVAMIVSVFISWPSVRLHGDYFILASFGFQLVIFYLMYNWVEMTGGPSGLYNIPRPEVFGINIDSLLSFALLSTIAAAISLLAMWLLTERSPLGRAIRAIRDDEVAAQTLGINVVLTRMKAFALASALAGASGAIFAHYMSFIDPSSFTVDQSIFLLAIVIIGGLGTLSGPFVGVLVMILIPEVLGFLEIPGGIAPKIRQMIYGLMLIILMFWRPQGLAGRYKFD